MKLTLFTHRGITSTLLPEKCAGQYWITVKGTSGKSEQIMAVEGIRAAGKDTPAQWVLKSNSRYQILDVNRHPTDRLPLKLLSLCLIRDTREQVEYSLYTEPLSEDRKRYTVYEVWQNEAILSMGSGAECDIRYASPYLNRVHAKLHFRPDGVSLTDENSLNHTFVNRRAVRRLDLNPGDVIYMMGMQIVVAGRYLYINNPDGNVTVSSGALRIHHAAPYQLPAGEYDDTREPEEFDDFYFRAPRFMQNAEPMELRLDAPPAGQTGDQMPLVMSIGPSVTMGMASATTAAFSVVNAVNSGDPAAAIPSLVMSLGMLSGTLLWPIVTKTYQKKLQQEKEITRQETYRDYLLQVDRNISQEITRQQNILRENDGSLSEQLAKVLASPPQIWERTPRHSDFLRLRLGSGSLPVNMNIQYPERRFSVERDKLIEVMHQFGQKERLLTDVPICLSLTERFVSGIYGAHKQLMGYACGLILQLAARHSYDEVKLVVLYDESDEKELSFVRWLPHAMDNERRVRYIATNREEAKILSADLEAIVEYRKGLSPDQLREENPYYVVLCLDKRLASGAGFLRTVMESKENLGFSVIALYDRLKDLPKECSAVVELHNRADRDEGILTLLNDVCEEPVTFRQDSREGLDMNRVTQVLANTILDVRDSAFRMPRKYTFMEMLDVGMVEHINLLENWSASDPTKSLAAPIGIDPQGEHFFLDLHERAHGPHGLVAGMTGSGKSETIMAYILAMAIHYHPNDVAFILIDYKGGGMAKAFEHIPHTAGIITNLDGNAINRSLVSMQSELHRRELIFQSVSKKYGISNIDIYKYQKLYREGKVTEPLPHLIIISDEFAELKKDQPDFMAALTSTARVGRSLGVHLILATQKPGGVVDDQIRSNSRFRLCLKVQDRGDSMEMMGRPEAANIVETGRFYLQVGNNELFELGQSAWAGAAYHPAARAVKDLDDAITVVNTNGRVIAEVNSDRFAGVKDAPKQLDAITEYIAKISDEEQIRRWKMWLDPIPAAIYADALAEKYPAKTGGFTLEPLVGEYDDPAHQKQAALRLPISRDGNVLVYGSAGSGKGLFLETLCYTLLRDHTPDEVNLYILDFGAETLTAFAGAPHVGEVILSHEAEKVNNLFKLLLGRLNARKKLLAAFGGSLEQYNAQASTPEPNIVVCIHNFANFTELYDQKTAELNYLTREGAKYGIYFVLTCTGVNNVKFSMQQNFRVMYCMQMNNTGDYSVVLGKTGNLLPEKFRGRGMFRADRDTVLEFQTAHVVPDAQPYGFYREFCDKLAVTHAGKRAGTVPTLPQRVDEAYLARFVKAAEPERIPVGVEKETLQIARLDFTAKPLQLILSQNREWKPFTEAAGMLLANSCQVQTILLAPDGTADPKTRDVSRLQVCTDRTGCILAVYDIFQQVLLRNNSYKTAQRDGKPTPEFQPLFVIIQSMAQLKTLMDDYVNPNAQSSDDTPINRLKIAMEKNRSEYRVYFLVAEQLQALTPSVSDAWYKTQVDGSCGIWIGNGISSQYRINVSSKPAEYGAALPEGFGYVIRDNAAVLVKFLQ